MRFYPANRNFQSWMQQSPVLILVVGASSRQIRLGGLFEFLKFISFTITFRFLHKFFWALSRIRSSIKLLGFKLLVKLNKRRWKEECWALSVSTDWKELLYLKKWGKSFVTWSTITTWLVGEILELWTVKFVVCWSGEKWRKKHYNWVW